MGIMELNDKIIDHDDGSFYLPFIDIVTILRNSLVFLAETQKNLLIQKLSSMAKTLHPSGQILDIDRVLEIFVDEFFEARKKIQKTLSQNFIKGMDSEKCLISYENLKRICAF